MLQIIENTEFGLDMIRGLPRAYFCTKNNIPHQCIVKPGLKPMYELVSNNVIDNAQLNINNPPDLYNFNRPQWTKDYWCPPPLKDMFKDCVDFEKPTVVINNKFTVDWVMDGALEAAEKYNLDVDMGQIQKLSNDDNGRVSTMHYSLPMLSKLIEKLSNKYKIIYISPILNHHSYFVDTNIDIPVDDYGFLEKNYPDVYTIKQFLEENKNITDNFNIAQFMLEASADKHLTVRGGNCKISAYFGGDVIMYGWEGFTKHHRKGNRDVFKTGSWFRHLSNANILGIETYDEILNYIDNNWI